ncbi:MAG: M13 family metallopeptidase [Bacteroidales bacterium]|nr:M13 family metallopeptidase [Bacteroidales bacterium]
MKKLFAIMIPVMMLAACQPKEAKAPALDPTDMDLSVKPGDDFFLYANGGWMKKNPLKPEYARFGSFDVLREQNVENLNALFSEMTTMNPEAGTIDQKIVDLYKQGLDSTRLNAEGAAPLKKYLDELYAISDKKALAAHLGKLNLVGEGGFFGGGVEADLMDSKNQIFYLGQGGLGMGDRDYYVDPANAALRKGYEEMLCKLFTLAGLDKPESRAANAAGIEDKLAAFSWTSVQNRDYTKMYNPMSSAQIYKAYPGFDFKAFAQAMGLPEMDKVIVQQPSFFQGFSNLFKSTPIDVLKDYLAAQLISGAAGSLSDDFYKASFDFFSTQMSGVTEQRPRWKRAMSVPNSILGEAVGQMYVAKFFPESSKQKMLDLVKNLQISLGQHIDGLEWMSDATKARAREKLAAFTVKIGYPDKWKDYSSLQVDPQLSYYENLRAASAWYVADNLSKLGKPTDPTEWGMTPQTVNAYYNPTTNEICFPAGILQPPFFNPEADDAVNYGAIGVVIGHEMTHGFDDQGSLFDKDGNMNNWWTDEDRAAFVEKTKVLANQFSEVEVVPGVKANGELTLGENIADHGGVSVAWTAFHNAIGDQVPAPIDGFTADQRFFLGYARVWAQNITDEEKARLTKLDVHSLGNNRVNVTLRNFGYFFDAFGIQEGDAMWRPESERVHIW